jgi:hypothetical protein
MLLKKAKMNRSKFLPLRPSKPVFRNPTHHSELTKAAGWKSDCLYVPPTSFSDDRTGAFEKICSTPRKTFFNSIGQTLPRKLARGAAVIPLCVDGSELARIVFTLADLVGAPMCSACLRGSHDRWP